MPTTLRYGIVTPDYKEPADGPAAFKAVADAVDAVLWAQQQQITAQLNSITTGQRTRTSAFLLGGA